VTFHPWHARCGDTDHPDRLRIDLDPQEGTDFEDARRVAAQVVRPLLAELGYEGVVKTSGGRGLHIDVPIEPKHGFTEVRRAALALGRLVERVVPDEVTTAWWKEQRGAKLFVDYNQNARDRTIASAYSVRRNPRGKVSTPITWDELDDVVPDDCTIVTVPERFERVGDLWAALGDRQFPLEPLLDLADRDEKDRGMTDAPYPPNYPKMPGEPPRVQPSRRKRPAGGDTA
jgi:DNA primase